MKEIKLTRSQTTWVDEADFHWLNELSWYACWSNGRCYARTGVWDAETRKTKQIRMHSLLMNRGP